VIKGLENDNASKHSDNVTGNDRSINVFDWDVWVLLVPGGWQGPTRGSWSSNSEILHIRYGIEICPNAGSASAGSCRDLSPRPNGTGRPTDDLLDIVGER
jgi:hypothetical protein